MTLTEEERRKIYEEEKARLEAKEKLKHEKGGRGCLIAALIIFGLIIFVGLLSQIGKERPSQPPPVASQVRILDELQRTGFWKVDRQNHRCLVTGAAWAMLPLERKEQCLKAIYVETNTWWEIYDSMSGKLLGEVSSWGIKVHP